LQDVDPPPWGVYCTLKAASEKLEREAERLPFLSPNVCVSLSTDKNS
jgi:hypothetical protein